MPQRAINEAKLQILTLVSQLEEKYGNFQQLPKNLIHSQYYDYSFPPQQGHVEPSSSSTTSSSSQGFMQYNYEEGI